MSDVFSNPSVYAHISGGGLILVVLLAIYFNYTSLKNLKVSKLLMLLLLLSIAISLHGISHLGMEYVYGYNPYNFLVGKRIRLNIN